jgi:hypothetical protein
MTFSREIRQSHYRTPRSVSDAFGPYARYESAVRHPFMRDFAERVGYIVCGLTLGGVISSVMYGAYTALCWAVTK